MASFVQRFWHIILRFAPTCALQDAMIDRDGVETKFIYPGESFDLHATGVCWVIVNRD